MQKLTELLLGRVPGKVLANYELRALIKGSDHRRYGLVKRALASGELVQVRRGLYAISPTFSGQPVDLFELAGRIYGPSYVSLESAFMPANGLIPEAVRTVTSTGLAFGAIQDAPWNLQLRTESLPPVCSVRWSAGPQRPGLISSRNP